jgi:hypothetical protein
MTGMTVIEIKKEMESGEKKYKLVTIPSLCIK